MKHFGLLFFATVAAAAKLDNVFLPPNSGSSSGANAGLQAPYSNQNSGGNQAQILKYDSNINEQGYHYDFESSDGIKAEQDGRVSPGANPEEGNLQVSGSYSYIGDDGQTYSITYTADENGYHPSGAHLPTPPPIPEAILKSLQLTAGNNAQYNSKRSSYDADAGY